jgi:hypothetical protein
LVNGPRPKILGDVLKSRLSGQEYGKRMWRAREDSNH